MNRSIQSGYIEELLETARKGQGLLPEDVRAIFNMAGPDDWRSIFDIARDLTEQRFNRVIHVYVPLYFSSICVNDCSYCGFRKSNREIKRIYLKTDAFLQEANYLWAQGHRSLLLVAAEHPVASGPLRIAKYIHALKKEGMDFDIALEVGPLGANEYRELHEFGVNRCFLYQESYNRKVYDRLHEGPKKDFDHRYHAMGRALAAGIEHVGLGILLGLHDFREEAAELVRHAQTLNAVYGRPVSTISLPRIQSAHGIGHPEFGCISVGDDDFMKIIALIRLALPAAGVTLTTRESPDFREEVLRSMIGITHMSAGVSTAPGGYAGGLCEDDGQFYIQDRRSLKIVLAMIEKYGFRPSLHPTADRSEN